VPVRFKIERMVSHLVQPNKEKKKEPYRPINEEREEGRVKSSTKSDVQRKEPAAIFAKGKKKK